MEVIIAPLEMSGVQCFDLRDTLAVLHIPGEKNQRSSTFTVESRAEALPNLHVAGDITKPAKSEMEAIETVIGDVFRS